MLLPLQLLRKLQLGWGQSHRHKWLRLELNSAMPVPYTHRTLPTNREV